MATLLVLLVTAMTACTSSRSAETTKAESEEASHTSNAAHASPTASKNTTDYVEPEHGTPVQPQATTDGYSQALFAGGCFWCMEPPFDKVDGVVATVSGYAGGSEKDPSYKQVAYGRTGHTESVLVVYDPDQVTYEQLLDVFWRSHDPTDAKGQFVDRGSQYRPAVFVYGEEQRKAAEKSKRELQKSGPFEQPIVTEIVDAPTFWPAEKYHQNFYKKDPAHYKRYRSGSGRDQFLDKHW
jgi:methionine-S-sulfoxide reductase